MLWWVIVLWLAKSTAEQNCTLDCRCTQPMEIDCSGSGHLTLDPSLFSGLGVRQTRRLYLHENRLTTIDRDLLAWLGQLRLLTLHDNLLMTLCPEVFCGQRNLETLLLYNNALAALPPNLFATMISLKVLSLASNRLNNIHSEQFANNILLESLDLSKNELHFLPIDFLSSNIRLKELLLNDNMLETLPQEFLLPVVKSLKVLDISGNHWLRPPLLPEFKHLDSLEMSRCNITYIANLPMYITRLDVSYNLLQGIPANLPLNLRVLNLTGNRLEALPDVELFPGGLQNLSLSHNKFRKLSPLPSSLQFLWLDYADVRSPIDGSIFAGATQLRYLNLEGNKLTSPLGNNVFKLQTKLDTLVLAGNCLATLVVKDFTPLKGIRLLNISNNPLRCDCGVKNTRDWATQQKLVVVTQICDNEQWDEALGELDCNPTTTTPSTTTIASTTTSSTTTTTPSTTTTTTSTTTSSTTTTTPSTTTTTRSTTSSTTTTTPPTTTSPTTVTPSTSTSSTSSETEAGELVSRPSMGQLILNHTKKDSSAPRIKVCCVLVAIAVISVEVT